MKYQFADYVNQINALFVPPLNNMSDVLQLAMGLSNISTHASMEGDAERTIVMATALQRLATESKPSAADSDEMKYKKALMGEALKIYMDMVKMDFDDAALKSALAKVQTNNPLIVAERKNLEHVVIPTVETQPAETSTVASVQAKEKVDQNYNYVVQAETGNIIDLFKTPPKDMREVIDLVMQLSNISNRASIEGEKEKTTIIATVLQRLATESKPSAMDKDEMKYTKALMGEALKIYMDMIKLDFDDATLKSALAKVQTDNPLIVQERNNLQQPKSSTSLLASQFSRASTDTDTILKSATVSDPTEGVSKAQSVRAEPGSLAQTGKNEKKTEEKEEKGEKKGVEQVQSRTLKT
ncbi:hypothetical protein [Aquicella siphonis]|nr:hypothetical protein [Aquicella siphonis]